MLGARSPMPAKRGPRRGSGLRQC
jgi:hypothetical protein